MESLEVEISCGAVLFEERQGRRYYVLVSSNKDDNCGLPKGHIEGNETQQQTALREIMEETGVKAEILDGFQKQIEYIMPNQKRKRVVYFAARFENQQAISNEPDKGTVMVLPFPEVLNAVTFENVRDVLIAADNWLSHN